MARQDIFPQFEVGTCTIAVADTAVFAEVDFPNDLVDGEVLELTSISVFMSGIETPGAIADMSWELDIGTRTGELTFADPDLVFRASETHSCTDLTAESGLLRFERVKHYDLTDGEGKGMLVPADKLFVGYDTLNYAGTPEAVVRIYYRIQKVSSKEVLEYLTSA